MQMLALEEEEEEEEEDWKPPDTMKITSSISEKGGLLQIPNTGIKLVFPPNAVTEGCNIQLSRNMCGMEKLITYALLSAELGGQNKNHFHGNIALKKNLTQAAAQINATVSVLSNVETGQRPSWEERPLSTYIFHRSKCTVRLLGFCWLKVKIDDTEVEAKNLVVFAAKKILRNKETAKVEVGYYEDLPERGEPNILKLNPDIKPERSLQLKFMKEGKQPLTISFNGTDPDDTWYTKQGKGKEEIPWQSIALSEERLVPFVLRRRKYMDSFCNFSAQQGNHNPIKFEVELEGNQSTGEIADSTVPDCILEPPDVLTLLHESLQKIFAEMTRSDSENLANFFMFPLKHVKAIINSPSHSKDLLVELENKGIIQSALIDELFENLGALNIKLLTGRSEGSKSSIRRHSPTFLWQEEGQRPRWEERPLSPYIFHRSKCTVRLFGFCWVKIVIDDKEVEAKNIVVFATKDILQDKKTANLEVGYYEDIPDRGEPNVNSLLNGISWQSIAGSEDRLVSFVLHRKQAKDSFCNVSAQQGNSDPIIFVLKLEVNLSTVESLDRKVPDSILKELARKLTGEWQMLARELNISECDLYNIKENNTGNIVNTKYFMLSHWSEMNGTGATCRVLAEALGKRDL
ncbi:hypothetical protein BSL78_21150 [Apostichopus japonicus]|uniref:Death domain-containing protein n=1 Tax=Stichopus japonicus TaxID=307972 RepID=A0A2G8K1W1_STIJA|nr:hypothetical protein BSL78_21150 [Apostichopus japonicus]